MDATPAFPPYRPGGDVVADKARWRSLVRAARREVVGAWTPQQREAIRTRLADLFLEHLHRGTQGGHAIGPRGRDLTGTTITSFEPMATEPPVDLLNAQLLRAGARVLVPITLARPRLDWADLTDPERRPQGTGVLAEVDLFLVPGLAVSAEGVRLGQGGGYYDTTLPLARELSDGAQVVVALHDHEVLPAVPADEHDVVVDAVLRPGSGVCGVPVRDQQLGGGTGSPPDGGTG